MRASCAQGWKKPGFLKTRDFFKTRFFLYKKTSPVGFFVFFSFFYIYLPEESF